MKKSILGLACLFFMCTAKAYFKITNTTCATISVQVFCHDATYPNCFDLTSGVYTINPSSTLTIANTSLLGVCSVNGGGTYTPANTQNWDGASFSITDGTNSPKGGVAFCNSTYWDSGSVVVCSHPNLTASLYISGSNTFLDFGFL